MTTQATSIMNKIKLTITLVLNITLSNIYLNKTKRSKLRKMCTLFNAKKGKITQHLVRKMPKT